MTATKNAEADLGRSANSDNRDTDFQFDHRENYDIPQSFSDLENNCLKHMSAHGVSFEGPIISDGRVHRFSIDNNKKKKDEWYVARTWDFKGKTYLVCSFGSWSTSDAKPRYESWQDGELGSLSKSEMDELKRQIKKLEEEREKEQKIRHDEAAKEAKRIWDSASPKPSLIGHEAYLNEKGVKAFNVRFGKNELNYDSMIIPIWNLKGEIRSLQFISVGFDGKPYKSFLSGGEKNGCFCVLGNLKKSNQFFIAEGYSTAASIHEATGVPVVIAFDCGNIDPVLKNITKKYPSNQITIAGDDDVGTKENAGRSKAEAASKKYGVKVKFPEFLEKRTLPNGNRPTDYNDLHVHFGIETVKKQLQSEEEKTNELAIQLAEGILKKQQPTERFVPTSLPPVLKNYIAEMSQFSAADPLMMVTSLLASISGCIKTNHFLPRSEYFQDLYPVLWMLNILESGGFKSTSINLGSSISQIKHDEVIKDLELARIEYEQQPDAEKLDGKGQDKHFAHILKRDVLLPNMTTAPGLLEDLSRGRGGTIFHHEFAVWLSQMEKTYNEGLKALFTTLFDVPDSFEIKTKGEGTLRITRPFISIYGVSALEWIKTQIKPSDVESGFFARFLLFLPTKADEIPDALPKQKDDSLLKITQGAVMKILSPAAEQKREYCLSSESKKLFESLHKKMYEECRKYDESQRAVLEPYLKRWSPYLLKLAMLFQPFFESKSSTQINGKYPISADSLIAAASIVQSAIKSTVHLFSTELGESDHQKKSRKILQYLAKNNGRVKRGKLLASKVLPGGKDMYNYPLETLVETGEIIVIKATQGGVKNDEYILSQSH